MRFFLNAEGKGLKVDKSGACKAILFYVSECIAYSVYVPTYMILAPPLSKQPTACITITLKEIRSQVYLAVLTT